MGFTFCGEFPCFRKTPPPEKWQIFAKIFLLVIWHFLFWSKLKPALLHYMSRLSRKLGSLSCLMSTPAPLPAAERGPPLLWDPQPSPELTSASARRDRCRRFTSRAGQEKRMGAGSLRGFPRGRLAVETSSVLSFVEGNLHLHPPSATRRTCAGGAALAAPVLRLLIVPRK